MCLGLYYYLFLLSTVYLIVRADDEPPVKMFADVIKNISRINNMLEDLVNNYEKQHKNKLQSNQHTDKLGEYIDTDKKTQKEFNLEKKRFYETEGKETPVLDVIARQKKIARNNFPSSTPANTYRDVIKSHTYSNEFIEPIKTETKYRKNPSKTYLGNREYEPIETKPSNSFDGYIGPKGSINPEPVNTYYKPYKTNSREYIQPALGESKQSDIYSNKLKNRDYFTTIPTVSKYNEVSTVKTIEHINPAYAETKYMQKYDTNSRDYMKPPSIETNSYKKPEPIETRYEDSHKTYVNSREHVRSTPFQTKYHDTYEIKTNLGGYTTHEPIDTKHKLVKTNSGEYEHNEHKGVISRDEVIMPMKKRYELDSNKPHTIKRHRAPRSEDEVINEKVEINHAQGISSILKYAEQNLEVKKKENVNNVARQKMTSETPAKSMINVRIYAKLDSNNTYKKVPIRKGKTEIRPKAFNRPTKIETKETHSKEEDFLLNKDMIKTNVLRDAYGEACLRLVVAKCYLACTGVSAELCDSSKCTNKFKDTFKSNARIKCISKFSNSIQLRRDDKTQLPLDEKVTDLAEKSGYTAVCLPMKDARKKMNFMFPEEYKYAKGLNILRDKYENACRNESIRRCTDACTCAYNDTCTSTVCPKITASTIQNKYCKKKCTSSFTFQRHIKKHKVNTDDGSKDDSSSTCTYETDDSKLKSDSSSTDEDISTDSTD